MTKAEILKQQKEKQIEFCNEFIKFTKIEGFIETIDKVGNFKIETPIFYKKISDNEFLLFNFPTFHNIKKYGFCCDFWKITVESEKEFLNSILDDKKLIDLRLGFTIERDLKMYRDELTKHKSL